jgi:hypothetical protein
LSTAILLEGELARPQAGTLVKRVLTPFREQTKIHEQRVEVERSDGSTRRFSLRRAPELRALTASIEAVLGGDLELLQRHFLLRMEGEDSAWVLHLTPRDARLTRRVQALRFLGAGQALHCMDLALVGDEISRTWLGEFARAAAAAENDAARDALCRSPV